MAIQRHHVHRAWTSCHVLPLYGYATLACIGHMQLQAAKATHHPWQRHGSASATTHGSASATTRRFVISLTSALRLPAWIRAWSARPDPHCWLYGPMHIKWGNFFANVVFWGIVLAMKIPFDYFVICKPLVKPVSCAIPLPGVVARRCPAGGAAPATGSASQPLERVGSHVYASSSRQGHDGPWHAGVPRPAACTPLCRLAAAPPAAGKCTCLPI